MSKLEQESEKHIYSDQCLVPPSYRNVASHRNAVNTILDVFVGKVGQPTVETVSEVGQSAVENVS